MQAIIKPSLLYIKLTYQHSVNTTQRMWRLIANEFWKLIVFSCVWKMYFLKIISGMIAENGTKYNRNLCWLSLLIERLLLESDALDPWTGLSRYDLDSMCKKPEVYAANRINDDEVCGTNMLTRWRRDKMADIFKCIYITWMKIMFRFKFHWKLFARVQSTKSHHRLR